MRTNALMEGPEPTIATENIRQLLYQVDLWMANDEQEIARKTWKMIAEQAEVYAKNDIEPSIKFDTSKAHPAT